MTLTVSRDSTVCTLLYRFTPRCPHVYPTPTLWWPNGSHTTRQFASPHLCVTHPRIPPPDRPFGLYRDPYGTGYSRIQSCTETAVLRFGTFLISPRVLVLGPYLGHRARLCQRG